MSTTPPDNVQRAKAAAQRCGVAAVRRANNRGYGMHEPYEVRRQLVLEACHHQVLNPNGHALLASNSTEPSHDESSAPTPMPVPSQDAYHRKKEHPTPGQRL